MERNDYLSISFFKIQANDDKAFVGDLILVC